jgi:hypothetical protein
MSSVAPQILLVLDEVVRNGFQSLRDSYFHKLTACTIAVVVGVILEEAEYFLSWPSVRRFIPLRILLPTHRFDFWGRIIAKLGWALIVIGVAGEGLYEARVSHADGWLQDFSNTMLATAQRQAAEAIGEAGRAMERAATLEKESVILRKKAEDEQAARLRIEETVAWRELTGSQQLRIGSALRKFAGQRAHIEYGMGDTEAGRFAYSIAAALALAKWNVEEPLEVLAPRPGTLTFTPLGSNPIPFETGVNIAAIGSKETTLASDALAWELSSRGFDCTRKQIYSAILMGRIRAENSLVFTISISVAHRPNGPQGEAKSRTRQTQ